MYTTQQIADNQQALEDAARAYLADHPDALIHDIHAAIRDSWDEPSRAQPFMVFQAVAQVRPTPTLAAVDDAMALMTRLAKRFEWVAVFWDRGWGDHGETAEISIIVDGNGQMPYAYLTAELYKELRSRGVIAGNTYGGFKARRVHDFTGHTA